MCEAPAVEYFERHVLPQGILMQDAKRDDELLPQTFASIGKAIGTTPDGARKIYEKAIVVFRRSGGTVEGLRLLRELLGMARAQ